MDTLNPKYRYGNVDTFASLGALAGLQDVAKRINKREHERTLKRARDARYRDKQRKLRAYDRKVLAPFVALANEGL